MAGDALDKTLELDAVSDALSVGDVLVVGLPLRVAYTVAEDAEEAIITAADEDVAVLRREGPVGDDRGYILRQ